VFLSAKYYAWQTEVEYPVTNPDLLFRIVHDPLALMTGLLVVVTFTLALIPIVLEIRKTKARTFAARQQVVAILEVLRRGIAGFEAHPEMHTDLLVTSYGVLSNELLSNTIASALSPPELTELYVVGALVSSHIPRVNRLQATGGEDDATLAEIRKQSQMVVNQIERLKRQIQARL